MFLLQNLPVILQHYFSWSILQNIRPESSRCEKVVKVTVRANWPLLRRWESPSQQRTVPGWPDDEESRHQVPHHQSQCGHQGLAGGGRRQDTDWLSPGQAEGGADGQLRDGGQEGEEQQGEEEGGGHGLHLGRAQQADYQVVGETLTVTRFYIYLVSAKSLGIFLQMIWISGWIN